MRTIVTAATVFVFVGIAGAALFVSGLFTSQALHAPKISLDMNADTNTYVRSVDSDLDGLPDPGSNTMTVGSIENCFTHPAPGDNNAHLHGFGGTNTTDPRFQIIVRDVEDIIGYQARLNFDGTRIAITTPGQVNHTPFMDGSVPINFLNLPVDPAIGAHRNLFTSVDIQPAGANDPNATALISSAALAVETAGAAPDVPSKAPHDQTTRTYNATGGGVLAQFQYVVRAGQVGQSPLHLDLDDANPNPPGSAVVIFTPTGPQTMDLAEIALFDGFHREGSSGCFGDPTPCQFPDCTASPTPSPSPTATPGPSPTCTGPGCGPTTPSPTPTATRTATATATATRTPTATPTACPTCTPTPTATATGTATPTPVSRTFVVNTTTEAADANPGDNLCRTSAGTCSLQAAIEEADAVSGRDTINFSIGSGPQRIMQSPFGNIYTAHDSLIIDGSTQPGFSGTPLIEIDGSSAGFGGGLRLQQAPDSTIRDVAIVGSGFFGIYSTGSNNTFEGNLIGQRIDGTAAGNTEGGFFIGANNNTIRDNVIANNGGGANRDGVEIAGGTSNLIQGNSIFNNAGLGIDLAPDGVTPNDPGDGDTGANNLQNFPVLDFAGKSDAFPSVLHISGTLNSTPNTTFTLEFFKDRAVCSPPELIEGRTFVGSSSVTTDSNGNASFSEQFTDPSFDAESVTATATDPGGNTSEISRCTFVSIITPTPSPSPSPSPGSVTPTPTATATPTSAPTATPTVFTANNTTGQAASDLHIVVQQNTATHSLQLITNAPGCPQPSITVNRTQDVDFEFIDDVVWSSACVDPGESATFSISCGSNCQIRGLCYNWTIFGSPIGTQCPSVRPTPTPTATATPGPITPTPTATPIPITGHDARLTRIGGVPKNVRLSPGEVIADSASIVVANESNHSETIGVYVDVMAPVAGGCTPNGRVLETTVTLAAGAKTTLPVPVSYSCADVTAANGQSYVWTAVADHGADDLASCGAGSLQGLACFNALADDDEDPADNRRSRTGPKVVAQ